MNNFEKPHDLHRMVGDSCPIRRLADQMISALLPEVRDILERRWHDVELIAGLLLKHGRITPEMIDEVLLLAAPNDKP